MTITASFPDYIPHDLHPDIAQFLAKKQGLRIGAESVITDDSITVENPSTGETIAQISIANSTHIDHAVAVAREALNGAWGTISAEDRGVLIWRLGEEIAKRKDIFGQLDALDNGKPLHIATDVDAIYSAKHFRYFAGWTNKIEGQTIPVSAPNRFNYTVIEPVGVCALITPWNYPLLMVAWKLAPALAAGNTIVLKPAEQTPLSALYLADLALEIGFPAGVLNVLTGHGVGTGDVLANHMEIDKVAFTGSTQTGREIVKASAGNLKKISLELGGKSANIIFADANLDSALSAAFWALFGNNGQSCTAGARLYVHDSIYATVVEKLVAMTTDVRVGPGFAKIPYDLGPVINQAQMEKVLRYIASAKKQGARVITGGKRLGNHGYFIAPTIITHVTDDMTVMCEEIFGPVLCVSSFANEDEVIARANNTVYGLAAGFWTQDLNRSLRVSRALKAGTIWTNCWGETDAASPFGGMGQSGYGREMGREAFDLYTQVKSIWVGET